MNRNRMLVLAIVALILSGGVSYLAYRVLQGRLQPAEVTSKVVVAAKKMDLGYLITKDDIKILEWPKSMPLEGSFNDASLVVDRGTMAPIQINEPILESKLAPKGAGAGLMTLIPEGMRALSIQVNSIIGVAGFLQPGSRVDLILTAVPPKDAKGAKGAEMGSKIILENLEVIAAGQNVQKDVEGKPQTVQNVTLLLTPDQVERVALATGDGRIQLALRHPMDKEAAEPALVVRSDLYEGPTMEKLNKDGSTKASPEKPEVKNKLASKGALRVTKPTASAKAKTKAPVMTAPLPPPPQRIVVELIQGSKRSQNTFEATDSESTEDSTKPDKAIQ
jgi:pilus assembly protein CpaB